MQRFVREYLVDGNGTQAAIRAGYAESGSRVTACRLLTHANIRAEIANGQARQFAALQLPAVQSAAEITAQMIVARAWDIAMRDEAPAAAQVSALTLLAKRHPEFSEKREVSGPDGGPIQHDIRAIVALRDELKQLREAL